MPRINEGFYQAVRAAFERQCAHFESSVADITECEFLNSFPYVFHRHPEQGESEENKVLVREAFTESLRGRAEHSMHFFFENVSGGTNESNLRRAVDDFLNFAIPRCIGLPNWIEQFDQLYRRFENDLFGDTFVFTSIALVGGAADHGANVRPSGGVSFRWANSSATPTTNDWSRKSFVEFLELKKAATPIANGRSLDANTGLFLLVFEEEVAKSAVRSAMSFAAQRATDTTRKVIFLLRLLTYSPVFSDYRGVRVLGHLSPFNFDFMNWPDEYVENAPAPDLGAYAHVLERMIPATLATPYSAIEVLDHKVDDALKRKRMAVLDQHVAETRVAADQVLDYFQALESIIPIEGSYQLSLYAGVLLGGDREDSGVETTKVFSTVKDMHKLRNDIMHGRLDDVLRRRQGGPLVIRDLQRVVHRLALIKLLNPHQSGNLKDLAHRLLLRQPVSVVRP